MGHKAKGASPNGMPASCRSRADSRLQLCSLFKFLPGGRFMKYLQRNKRASVLLAWIIVFTLLFTQSLTVMAAKPEQAGSQGKSSSSQGSANSGGSSSGSSSQGSSNSGGNNSASNGGSSAEKSQGSPAVDTKTIQSAAESKNPQSSANNKNTQNNGNASNIINKLKNPNAPIKGVTQAAITMAAITVEAITVDASSYTKIR